MKPPGHKFIAEELADGVTVYKGDCRDVLRTLPAESVHCVVTSPPYWGLRDYDIPPPVWGGDPACKHHFACKVMKGELRLGSGMAALGERYRGGGHKIGKVPHIKAERGFCSRCGAWRVAFGLEPTIQLYVAHAVEIFHEVKRVLRKDGTLWLNLGDSYFGGGRGRGGSFASERRAWRDMPCGISGTGQPDFPPGNYSSENLCSLKPKDLCGIPWRVAFALQADGWWLRQDIIWEKPSPMPESVTDRCTKAHEYIFLLTKSPRYFYDAETIKEDSSGGRATFSGYAIKGADILYHQDGNRRDESIAQSRNKRSVWTVSTVPFQEAHFAAFPPKLVEPCIKAGTSEKGCCAKCGAPWIRKIEKKPNPKGINAEKEIGLANTIGWSPSCQCNAPIVPCIVLDPFAGSGTTGIVSINNGRRFIGIDLSDKYFNMITRRTYQALDTPNFLVPKPKLKKIKTFDELWNIEK